MGKDEFLANMGIDINGLTKGEAARRLSIDGPNILPEKRKRLYKKFQTQFKNLFNVLLLLAALLSFISGEAANVSGSVGMGVVLLIIVLINILFSIFQERRAERAMEAIKELVPANTKVIRGGEKQSVPLREIVFGDLLELEEGDRIPADARVIEAYNLSVDNSSLTGESEPQSRSAEPESGNSTAGAIALKNIVLAGTNVLSGNCKAVVLATGLSTQFGKIVREAREVEEPLSPLQLELNNTAKLNFIIAIFVGVIFLLIAFLYLHLDIALSLLFMIGVMISLVPEGFQVTVTLALAISSRSMSKRNVVVKRLSAVETLGSATVICTDKTGTITEGQMTARMLWLGGTTFQVTGEGYGPSGSIINEGKGIDISTRNDILELIYAGALDNNAALSKPREGSSRWTSVGDPMEAALLTLASKAKIDLEALAKDRNRVGLIPFDSNRKMMTSLNRVDDTHVAIYTKGAGSEVVGKCVNIHWGQQIVPLSDDLRNKVLEQVEAFGHDSYRVLALAHNELSEVPTDLHADVIERDLTLIGLVAFYDPPRAETADAVRKARSAGIKVIMLTGDHEQTAASIARMVGIITDHGTVVTGSELDALSDDELSKTLEDPELVFARTTAQEKLRIVRLLRSKGEVVAVTGDGINDVPALLEADIGVAMGQGGTDVARESGDMVLLQDNFASIVESIEQGRAVFDNLKKFLIYVFTHNWAEFIAFIAFVALGTPLPLAVVQVLAIDLLLEIPASLSLTMDPPHKKIMERKPRPRNSRILDASVLSRTLFMGIIIGIASLFWCFYVWSQHGWALGASSVGDSTSYMEGTTVEMAGIMIGQLATLIVVRSDPRSRFTVLGSRNKWVPRTLIIEAAILLAIIYIPILQQVFSTANVPPLYLLYLFSIVPFVLIVEILRRSLAWALIYRRRKGRHADS